VRIRRKSAASTPMPRTAHILGSVLPVESPADRLKLDSTWVSHVFFPRLARATRSSGAPSTSSCCVAATGASRAEDLLRTNYIPTMLDVYCV